MESRPKASLRNKRNHLKMKAKQFNNLEVGDKVVIKAPDDLNALGGKIVAKFVFLMTPAKDKTKDEPASLGEATFAPWGFYHDAKTRDSQPFDGCTESEGCAI